eukprot:2309532-Prymnesium_polylepis.1
MFFSYQIDRTLAHIEWTYAFDEYRLRRSALASTVDTGLSARNLACSTSSSGPKSTMQRTSIDSRDGAGVSGSCSI